MSKTTGTTIEKTTTPVIEGRAITPVQKQAIMERLLTLWTTNFPDLRLGQFIACAMGGVTPDLLHIEDSVLVGTVESYVAHHKSGQGVTETTTNTP